MGGMGGCPGFAGGCWWSTLGLVMMVVAEPSPCSVTPTY